MRNRTKDSPLILCVEDEPDLRLDIKEELQEAGYRVMAAGSVKTAWQKMQETRPDLILCDIYMPFENGYVLLERVKQAGAAYADVPFVFLTALNDARDVVAGKRLGADDYLVKPINYDLMLATVDARLRQVGRIHSGIAQAPKHVDERLLVKQFALTRTEIRVVMALTDGLSLTQTAKRMNVARSTTAFHLRNIFQKTDTKRQSELIALIMQTCLEQ